MKLMSLESLLMSEDRAILGTEKEIKNLRKRLEAATPQKSLAEAKRRTMKEFQFIVLD